MADATALIVIDMQRDFCAAGGYAAQAGLDVRRLSSVIEHIGMLLDAARQSQLLVLHTREGHLPDLSDCPPQKRARSQAAGAAIGSTGPMGRLLIRGEYGHGIIDQLAPLPDETVIDKPGYGAFYKTDLEAILQRRAIRTLILCGVTTEVCVHSTLREAVDRGYECIVAGDACAASNPALQQPALDMIAVEGGIFGRVAGVAEALSFIKGAP
ncbi:MAG: rutB [Herbaspirillum sp.]|nr:rutB [Herbaspirillum sp.]